MFWGFSACYKGDWNLGQGGNLGIGDNHLAFLIFMGMCKMKRKM